MGVGRRLEGGGPPFDRNWNTLARLSTRPSNLGTPARHRGDAPSATRRRPRSRCGGIGTLPSTPRVSLPTMPPTKPSATAACPAAYRPAPALRRASWQQAASAPAAARPPPLPGARTPARRLASAGVPAAHLPPFRRTYSPTPALSAPTGCWRLSRCGPSTPQPSCEAAAMVASLRLFFDRAWPPAPPW